MKYFALIALAVLLAVAVWYARHRGGDVAAQNQPTTTLQDFKRRPDGAFTADAGEFLMGLAKDGKLPGFAQGEHGNMQIGAPEAAVESYPVTRAAHFSKDGDTSDYLYVVVRDSERAPWRLLKAARMTADGQVIQEFTIP